MIFGDNTSPTGFLWWVVDNEKPHLLNLGGRVMDKEKPLLLNFEGCSDFWGHPYY